MTTGRVLFFNCCNICHSANQTIICGKLNDLITTLLSWSPFIHVIFTFFWNMLMRSGILLNYQVILDDWTYPEGSVQDCKLNFIHVHALYVMQSRGISWKSNMWHFQFSIWLECSLGEVHFAENLAWIRPVVPKL